jgi:hypothetical protein
LTPWRDGLEHTEHDHSVWTEPMTSKRVLRSGQFPVDKVWNKQERSKITTMQVKMLSEAEELYLSRYNKYYISVFISHLKSKELHFKTIYKLLGIEPRDAWKWRISNSQDRNTPGPDCFALIWLVNSDTNQPKQNMLVKTTNSARLQESKAQYGDG